MASGRIEKLLAAQQKAEAQNGKRSSSSKRQNIKSPCSATKSGHTVCVNAAVIWSITCLHPSC